MKVSLKWVNEILRTELSADDIVSVLETIGFQVEQCEKKSESIRNVIVGEIKEVLPHPRAQRLSVCTVFDGQTDKSVVCGAPNVVQGLKVPLALVGAVLPGGKVIRKSTIRGVDSEGMICSEKELFMGDVADGIMHLPSSMTAGEDLCASLGLDDTIIEYEVTPNRPDVLSHIGIAREIAVARHLSFLLPKTKTRLTATSECKVFIEDPKACGRYCAQVIEGIKVGPTPRFIVQRLNACGIRSINNIVDVTNYVLLETGHPLHAFDYDLLENQEIHVRFSRQGESIKALDGKSYDLSEKILIIADRSKPVAIAGVIGGEDTAVSAGTTNILLEAAYFNPRVVRGASRKLDITTESSYRFERGIGMVGLEYASLRAVDLILMCAGGEKTKSKEVYQEPFVPVVIELNPKRVNQILGTNITKNTMADILNRLNMELKNKGVIESLIFQVPSFRIDLKEEIDLIEEIARHSGYHTIPTVPVKGVIMNDMLPETWTFQEEIRNVLSGAAFYEAYNYGFISPDVFTYIHFEPGDKRKECISVTNPLSQEFTLLRTTLLPGLIQNVVMNISKNNPYTRLYELGTVFFKNGNSSLEEKKLAGILTGSYPKDLWMEKSLTFDFRECTGIVEYLLTRLNVPNWKIAPRRISYFHPGRSACIYIDDKPVGEMGCLHPDIHEKFKFNTQVYYFEMNADTLMHGFRTSRPYKPLPRYPAIKRDFSFIFDARITWDQIMKEVLKDGGSIIEGIVPFDRYEGEKIRKDTYGLSFSLTLRSTERTLTDKEADEIQNKVINRLKEIFGAQLRT